MAANRFRLVALSASPVPYGKRGSIHSHFMIGHAEVLAGIRKTA